MSIALVSSLSNPDASAHPPESKAPPTSFMRPDLVSHCQFPLVYHPNGDAVAKQSVTWLDSNCPDLNQEQRTALRDLQAGELTGYCYNMADEKRLRVVADWLNYLFHLFVSLFQLQFICS